MTDAVIPDRAPLRARDLIKLGGLTLTSEREGAVHSICLFGELDLASAGGVQDELMRAEAGDAGSILFDLAGVTFIDSTGIRLLVNAAARSHADADRFVLLRGSPAVQRVLQLTGLEGQLPFAD